MTNVTIALAELAENGPDADMLRQMVQFMCQRLMDIDVESLCGAGYDEKSAERINSRNGFRDRSWETGVEEGRVKAARRCSPPQSRHKHQKRLSHR
jgi:putative transposase